MEAPKTDPPAANFLPADARFTGLQDAPDFTLPTTTTNNTPFVFTQGEADPAARGRPRRPARRGRSRGKTSPSPPPRDLSPKPSDRRTDDRRSPRRDDRRRSNSKGKERQYDDRGSSRRGRHRDDVNRRGDGRDRARGRGAGGNYQPARNAGRDEPRNPPYGRGGGAQNPAGGVGYVPPPPGYAPVVAAPTPPPQMAVLPKTISFTVQSNFQRFTVAIEQEDKVGQAYLTKLGIPSRIVSPIVNPHQLGAAIREYLTARALVQLYTAGCRRIVSLYGSPRDLSITKFLNKNVTDPFTLEVYHPLVTIEDLARNVQGPPPDLTRADGFLAVNVYEYEDAELSAPNLAALLGVRPLVWVGTRYDGELGIVNGSSVWQRSNDKILVRPDTENLPYVNTDMSWLTNGGTFSVGQAHWGWTPFFNLAGNSLVLFRSTPTALTRATSSRSPRFVRCAIPKFSSEWFVGLQQWAMRQGWFTREVTVDAHLVHHLKNWKIGRTYNNYSFRAMINAAQTFYEADAEIVLLKTLAPALIPDLLSSSVLVAFYVDVDKDQLNLRSSNIRYGKDLSEYNDSLKNLGQPVVTPTVPKKVFLLLFAAYAVYMLRGRFLDAFRRVFRAGSVLSITKNETIQALIAPFWEEPFKRLPVVGPALPFVELWLRVHVHGLRFGIASGLLPLGMHLWTMSLPLKKAILVHLLYNCMCIVARPGVVTTNFQRFISHYYEQPWSFRNVVEDTSIAVTPYPPNLVAQPKQTVSHCGSVSADGAMKVLNSLDKVEVEAKTSVYFYLPVNVPMYSPAATDANAAAVIATRILRPAPMPSAQQRVRWRTVNFPLKSMDRLRFSNWVALWLANFDDTFKRRRAEKALVVLGEQGFRAAAHAALRSEVMVKTDEILMRLNETAEMRPRAIVNIAPLVQAAVGPYVYGASVRLHEVWSWTPSYAVFGGWRIWVCYGTDANDHLLTSWMGYADGMRTGDVHVLVAGDDSLVLVQSDRRYVIEADASMFDQSQSYGPLLAEYRFLHNLGVPRRVTKVLLQTARSPYFYYSKLNGRIKVQHDERPMRPTGGADTSLGNSIVMGMAWCHVVHRYGATERAVRDGFSYLGLDMKFKFLAEATDATFLKGMWYVTDAGLVWGPLPSRILKAGKSLADPRIVTKTPDLREACASFAGQLACSYGQFVAVPVLRAFVERFKRPYKPQQIHKYKPQFSGRYAGVPVIDWSNVCRRYRCQVDDLRSLEALYRQAEILNFIQHPLCLTMAMVDYN